MPSPWPAYVLGSLGIGVSLHSLTRPAAEFGRLGLPVPKSKSGADAPGAMVYLTGIRAGSWGTAFIALQYQGLETAVTTLGAILTVMGFADGVVVWLNGAELKNTALAHWAITTGIAAWVALRAGLF